MTYRLSVVKASDGDYLVGCYYKAGDMRFADFNAALIQILDFASKVPEVFDEEPILRWLSEDEEKVIRGIRDLVLEARVAS